jgi:hypothetical protein
LNLLNAATTTCARLILASTGGAMERVICVGEAFWEPGGDVIHY